MSSCALPHAIALELRSGERLAGLTTYALPLDAARHYEPVLAASELERAARFRFDVDKQRHVLGVGAARTALAQLLGADPRSLRFELGEHGKPRLEVSTGLDFNVSHSGAWVLLALSTRGTVGVDVEAHRAEVDLAELAAEVFTPSERREMAALLGDAERACTSFFRTWSRKEAALKAWGTGLSLAAALVEVGLDDSPSREVMAPVEQLARLEVHDLELDDRHAAAVAVLGPR